MEIVFFRHGNALDVFQAKVSEDSLRPLSQLGKKEVRSSAEKLKSLKFKPTVIISSPYKRALETSLIIKEVLGDAKQIITEALVEKYGEEAIKEIFKLADLKNALVVGHQPLLGFMSAAICDFEEIQMPTAGFALIDIKDPKNFKGELKYNHKNGALS